jgi:hypothetical protein
MGFESYKKALLAEEFDELLVERVLDEYYHSGIPHVFRGDAAAHGQFRRHVANEISSAYTLNCHPHNVVVCGSAHLGFSAAPNRNLGRPFSFVESDIDVAVLLPELFDRWWLEMVHPKVSLGEGRVDIADDLLNGFISPQFVRDSTEIGRRWWRLFGQFTSGDFSKVRGRVYREPQFMQNYHRLSVIRGREKLRGALA